MRVRRKKPKKEQRRVVVFIKWAGFREYNTARRCFPLLRMARRGKTAMRKDLAPAGTLAREGSGRHQTIWPRVRKRASSLTHRCAARPKPHIIGAGRSAGRRN